MDNIINRLSRQPGQPEQYKKFNPNPIPETQPTWDIPQLPEPQFPEYEEWTRQIESGERQPQFQPTEMPGEMGTGEGIETGIPPEFQQLMDFLGITDPIKLVDVIGEATDKDLAWLFKLAGVKEEEPVKEVLTFPTTKEEAGQMILDKTMTQTQLEALAHLGLVPKEWVEVKLTKTEIEENLMKEIADIYKEKRKLEFSDLEIYEATIKSLIDDYDYNKEDAKKLIGKSLNEYLTE